MENMSIDYHTFSIGYHTFTVFTGVEYERAEGIRKAFERYSQVNNNIKYYPEGKKVKILFQDGTPKDVFNKYKAKYYIGDHCPVKWLVRFCNHRKDLNFFYIEATINPKILLGIIDYTNASDQSYLLGICGKYNSIIKEISDLIPEFKWYIPNRIDYCFNCDITHAAFGCNGKQMMKLIKRSDIPHPYKEYPPKYDKETHRREDTTYSHYLINDSVNINCYWKSKEQLKKHPDRKIPSENIIRFEVQCKYSKMYALRQNIKKDAPERFLPNFLLTSRLLADELSKQELRKYFNRIIKPGNYYRLKDAIRLINEKENLHAATKTKLIDILKLVDELEAIPNARKYFISSGKNKMETDDLRAEFNGLLRHLANLGINPVTIPERWRISFIPGIMTVHDF